MWKLVSIHDTKPNFSCQIFCCFFYEIKIILHNSYFITNLFCLFFDTFMHAYNILIMNTAIPPLYSLFPSGYHWIPSSYQLFSHFPVSRIV